MANKTIGAGTTLTSGYASATLDLTLTNLGVIGGASNGVALYANAASLVNAGRITGSVNGVVLSGGGAAATNQYGGTVSGGTDGIVLNQGGRVVNQAGATIIGVGFNGVAIYNAAGTVANAGTISGAVNAVYLAAGVANRVVMYPGAVFSGTVDGGTRGNNTLELAAGGAFGQISAIGSQYRDFSQIAVDAGAFWYATGSNTGAFADAGFLQNLGQLHGSVSVATSGILVNGATTASISAATAVTLSGTNAYLDNSGIVAGATGSGIGVSVQGAGHIVNPGRITGGADGVLGDVGSTLTLSNGGLLQGQFAVAQFGQLVLTNQSGGSVSGASGGIVFGSGTVTNLARATIAGAIGVGGFGGAGTVINYGSIIGSGGTAVSLASGYNNEVALAPGGSFVGIVDGGHTSGSTATSLLQLMAGSGTISGLGSSFRSFNTIGLAPNAAWTLSGSNTLAASIDTTGPATLVNTGSLYAASGLFHSSGGGLFVNGPSAVAVGHDVTTMISISGTAGTVINDGWLGETPGMAHASYFKLLPVNLVAGGTVVNHADGTIRAEHSGVRLGATGTVVNAGMIYSYYGTSDGVVQAGVYLNQGGVINNTGTIFGYNGIFARGAAATIINSGSIGGSGISYNLFPPWGDDIVLLGGGTIINQSGGLIGFGGAAGIFVAGGTIDNAGRIMHRVQFASQGQTFANRLILHPAAYMKYGATNLAQNAPLSAIELASGAASGTIQGIGSQYRNFDQIQIDSGASWTLAGSNTLGTASTISDSGTLMVSAATVSGGGTLSGSGGVVLDASQLALTTLVGSGAVTIADASVLDLQYGIAGGETLTFAGTGNYLHLHRPASVQAAVRQFAAGDTIDLTGVAVATVSYAAGTLSFGGGVIQLAIAGTGTLQATSSADGTELTVACFRQGSRIRTPAGDTAVEALRVGDRVSTLGGGGARRIIWIGHRRVACARHPRPDRVWPVRIRAGAFGPGKPARDLFLSPDHAVFLEDHLIPVRLLADGDGIAQVRVHQVTYYHVELAVHDIVWAEGLETESYLDIGDRHDFTGGGGPVRLFPDFVARAWDAYGYAPLVLAGPVLEAARARIRAHAGMMPRRIRRAV